MADTTDKYSYIGENNHEGQPHGKGTMHYHGVKYTGQWQDGVMHGKGNLTFEDGGVYDGDWQYGKKHGIGTLRYSNGSVFKGHWEEGQMEGWGVLTAADGETLYNGQWHQGKKHGRGINYFASYRYEGDFIDNKMHGSGILYSLNGERFEGTFVDNDMHIGIMYFPDGSRIDGEWKNGNINGCMVTADGKRTELSGLPQKNSSVQDNSTAQILAQLCKI